MKIQDKQIEAAFTGTIFGAIDGNVREQRDFLAQGIMKRVCNYSTGHTIQQILIELKLISEKTLKPSKESKRWMYDVIYHRCRE